MLIPVSGLQGALTFSSSVERRLMVRYRSSPGGRLEPCVHRSDAAESVSLARFELVLDVEGVEDGANGRLWADP